jgi:2-keto-4-pentenoate hydratase/2-oxohepta-3-ene-1,7-dioic acid hydratase in catechol pathway
MKRKNVLRLAAVNFGVMIVLALALAACSSVSKPLTDEALAPKALGSICITNPQEALTFARYRSNGELKVLLVSNYQNGTVEGIDLNEYFKANQTNPIDLFNAHGYDGILQAASSGSPLTSVSAMELEMPFEPRGQHIGIGLNYPEHGKEVWASKKQPFVFPKAVEATHFASDVSVSESARLDYEAELGFVALTDISRGTCPEHMGLVLSNDFTDRWTLVRQLRPFTRKGTRGFPDGKGKDGSFPVGNLFVIPRDLKAFYPKIFLTLYVNGDLRQSEEASKMTWGPEEMITEIFNRWEWDFHSKRGKIRLLPENGKILAGTIISSGTPAGVVFRPRNVWNKSLYLAPGDEVVMRSEHMGILCNSITE